MESTNMRLSDFLAEQLEQKGWAGADVCAMLGGVPKSVASKIINGRQAPTLHQMSLLAKMFDVSISEIVLMRQADERHSLERGENAQDKQMLVIDIFKTVPVSEMLKRRWASVNDRTDPDEIIRVFGPMLQQYRQQNGLAHKSGDIQSSFTPTQSAWLFQVRRLAERMSAPDFNHNALEASLDEVRKIMLEGKNFKRLFSLLSSLGIRIVFVECQRSKIDGVCTWLDPKSPVIGMSLRFDRDDNFWFVLRHEIEHILQGYSEQSTLDENLGSNTIGLLKKELSANKAASAFCAPQELVEDFIGKSGGRLREAEVAMFANQNKLLAGAFAGQIQHRLNRYNILRNLLKPIRESIISEAPMVDGWGRIPV